MVSCLSRGATRELAPREAEGLVAHDLRPELWLRFPSRSRSGRRLECGFLPARLDDPPRGASGWRPQESSQTFVRKAPQPISITRTSQWESGQAAPGLLGDG